MKNTNKKGQKVRIITIVGNVGAGKTTALPLVAEALNADFVKADEVFQKENPFREQFLKDLHRWAFASELWLVHRRVTLIKEAIAKSNSETIVIDSGLLMSWAYAKSDFLTGKMTTEEWDFFNKLFTLWSKFAFKTTLLYFTAPYGVLLKRIKKRGRDYEVALYQRTYLEQIDLGLKDLCANFEKVFDAIIMLDHSQIGNIVENKKDKQQFVTLIKKKFTHLTSGRK